MDLVIEWAALHRPELPVDWEKAQAQQELLKIDPLELGATARAYDPRMVRDQDLEFFAG